VSATDCAEIQKLVSEIYCLQELITQTDRHDPEDYYSSRIFSNMFNVAETILKSFYFTRNHGWFNF